MLRPRLDGFAGNCAYGLPLAGGRNMRALRSLSKMPVMDGLASCRAIRSEVTADCQPCITALTANSMQVRACVPIVRLGACASSMVSSGSCRAIRTGVWLRV